MPAFSPITRGALFNLNSLGVFVLNNVLQFSAFRSPANRLSQFKLEGEIRRLLVIVSVFLVVVLLMQPVASAQSQFATLSGSVRDGSGAVVRGARVTINNSASGEPRITETNADGFFAVPSLPVGTYNVTVELTGFQKWVGKGIALNGCDNRTLDIASKR